MLEVEFVRRFFDLNNYKHNNLVPKDNLNNSNKRK